MSVCEQGARCTRAFIKAVLGMVLAGSIAHSAAQSLHTPGEVRYVKGRILVQPRAGLTLQDLDAKLKRHGGRRAGHIPKVDIHIVQLPSQANERAVAAALAADPHIEFAELDRQVPAAMTPNDPNYPSGWHLAKIGGPQAWDYADGTGVTIAILDTGVDPTHPDIVANLVPGYNVYNNNTDTRDVHGHGTRVAGAAAMAGDNLLGGTGVSYKSKIMPVRVADANAYAYYSTLTNGLVWAADRGAQVASMSFLGVCGSASIQSGANYMRGKGGVVTGSAGNTGAQEAIAANESITCVSATDSSDVKASWSSYGSFVDIAAPGVGIFTTSNGGGYGFVSGTSFSAPITAGVYALMLAANPSLSPDQLDAALFSTALDLGNSAYYGYGRVDAAAAVAAARGFSSADTAPPSVSITSPSSGSRVNGLVSVNVVASDNVGVARVELAVSGSLLGTDSASPYSFSWDAGAAIEGDVLLEARAFDAAGNMARSTVTVTVSNDTLAPSVTMIQPKSGAVIDTPTTISANATDDRRVAKVSLTINGKEVALSYGSAVSYLWDPYAGAKGKGQLKSIAGSYNIRATATDDAGNTSSAAVSVTVP